MSITYKTIIKNAIDGFNDIQNLININSGLLHQVDAEDQSTIASLAEIKAALGTNANPAVSNVSSVDSNGLKGASSYDTTKKIVISDEEAEGFYKLTINTSSTGTAGLIKSTTYTGNSKAIYIKKGKANSSGSIASTTLVSAGYYNGTNTDETDAITLSETQANGYYVLNPYATGTTSIDFEAGYQDSKGSEGTISNTNLKSYYIAKATATAVGGLDDYSAGTITISAVSGESGETSVLATSAYDIEGSYDSTHAADYYFIKIASPGLSAAKTLTKGYSVTEGYTKGVTTTTQSVNVTATGSGNKYIKIPKIDASLGAMTGGDAIAISADISKLESYTGTNSGKKNITDSKINVDSTANSEKWFIALDATPSGGSSTVYSGAVSASEGGYGSGTLIAANNKSKTVQTSPTTTTKYINIDKGSVTGGSLSEGTAVAPTITFSEVSDSVGDNRNVDLERVDIGSKNTTNYKYFYRINAHTTGGGNDVTRAAINSHEGYIADDVAIASETATITAANGDEQTFINLKAADLTISLTGDDSFTPVISKVETASGNSAVNISANVGTITSTKPTSNYYVAVETASQNAKEISMSAGSLTTGWLGETSDITISDTASVGLNGSGIQYIPISGTSISMSSSFSDTNDVDDEDDDNGAIILSSAPSSGDYYTISASVGTGYTVADTQYRYIPKAVVEYVTDSTSGADFIEVKSGGYLPAGIVGNIVSIGGTIDEAALALAYSAAANASNQLVITASKGATTNPGYISTTQGSLTNDTYTVNAAAATASVPVVYSASLANSETAVSGKTRITATPSTSTTGISTYYIALSAGASGTKGNSDGVSVGTQGYLNVASQISTDITGEADSKVFYVPLTSGSVSVSGSTSATTPTVTKVTTDGSASGTNIHSSTGDLTESEPSSGYYVALTATAPSTSVAVSGSVSAGWVGNSNQVSGSATVNSTTSNIKYIPIDEGAASVSGGGLTAGSGSVSVTKYTTDGSNNGTNIHSNTGTLTTTEPSSGYYVAISASGSGSVTREDIKLSKTAGYIAGQSATTVISGTSISSSVAETIQYIPIDSGSATVAGGGLTAGSGSVSISVTSTDSGTAGGINAQSIVNTTLGTSEPTSGYFIALSASGSGSVSRAAITKTQTAGYIPAQSSSTVSGLGATSLSSNTATIERYLALTSAVYASNITSSSTNTKIPLITTAGVIGLDESQKYLSALTIPVSTTLDTLTVTGTLTTANGAGSIGTLGGSFGIGTYSGTGTITRMTGSRTITNLGSNTAAATGSLTITNNGGSGSYSSAGTLTVTNNGTTNSNGTITVGTNSAKGTVTVTTNAASGTVNVTTNNGIVNINGGNADKGVKVDGKAATVDMVTVSNSSGDLYVATPTFSPSYTNVTTSATNTSGVAHSVSWSTDQAGWLTKKTNDIAVSTTYLTGVTLSSGKQFGVKPNSNASQWIIKYDSNGDLIVTI